MVAVRFDGALVGHVGVAFYGSPDGLLALISYHNNLLRYRDNQSTGTYLTLQPASMGTWYLIELVNFDWVAQTYDIWVDGVERAVGAPFMAPGLVGVIGVVHYACPWMSGPSFIDDLTVSIADVTAPVVVITTPADQADYKLGEVVLADYACSDDGTGVASCDGPVVVGEPIDTSTLGQHEFSVTATDVAGNRTTVIHTYTISAMMPMTKDACKKGGWESYTDDVGTPFRNQGACVSYVASLGKSKAK